PIDGGHVDGEQQRRGDRGRSQHHPRAAGRESANRVRPGQSQRQEDEEGEWVDERRDAQENTGQPTARAHRRGADEEDHRPHGQRERERVERRAEGEEDERRGEDRDQPRPPTSQDEQTCADGRHPCGVEQEHDDHEHRHVIGDQVQQVDEPTLERGQGRGSAVSAPEHIRVDVTDERSRQRTGAHPRRGGRLRIAGVQARSLQGQGEESGEPEERGEDIGLTIAEPCTGRRQVNADRTAEQRLGDPGAGLRGHDSMLSVSWCQFPRGDSGGSMGRPPDGPSSGGSLSSLEPPSFSPSSPSPPLSLSESPPSPESLSSPDPLSSSPFDEPLSSRPSWSFSSSLPSSWESESEFSSLFLSASELSSEPPDPSELPESPSLPLLLPDGAVGSGFGAAGSFVFSGLGLSGSSPRAGNCSTFSPSSACCM